MSALKNQCPTAPPTCVAVNGGYACYVTAERCFDAKPVPVLSDIAVVLVILAMIIVGYLALRGKL